jgi:hypothetical protein
VGHPNALSYQAWVVKKRSTEEEEEENFLKTTSAGRSSSLPVGEKLLVASAAQGHAQAIVRLTQQMSASRTGEVCMYVCMHVCMYVCMYVCRPLCMYDSDSDAKPKP